MPNQSFRLRLQSIWAAELKDRRSCLKLLLIPVCFTVYSWITRDLAVFIEARDGRLLQDKLLQCFPLLDCSTPIFILLYASFLSFILLHIGRPKIMLRMLELHLWVAIVRQVCILLVALEPPNELIVLRDVFLENTVYPHDAPLTKDLFFSGHVASIWIYFLCSQYRYHKLVLLLAAFCMSFMVLSMRVHYTYDVYAAVVVTTLLYVLGSRIRRRWAGGIPVAAMANTQSLHA
jgi:hypothetical protein